MATKSQILGLYKTLLRESMKFPDYNYREYALRRVRDGFKASKTLQDAAEIDKLLAFAKESLEVIKRQVVVGQLYKSPGLVIEDK